MNLAEPFNELEFKAFVTNLLPDFQKSEQEVNVVNTSFDRIQKLGESPSLLTSVFIFKGKTNLESRVTLSKESFRVLKKYSIYRALIVYINEEDSIWRLSLLVASPMFDESGKVVVAFSNPRRFSYLLGPKSKIQTPTKMLLMKGKAESFEDLKSRFSIEVVNDEFFSSIAKLFDRLTGYSMYKPEMKYPGDNLSRNQYSVRLIGRLVFCWFLKEKKDESGKSLIDHQSISYESVKKNRNYLHTVVNPLFFEVLNTPVELRKENVPTYMSSIPFLNGGLFEPKKDEYYLGGKNKNSAIVINDKWFEDLFALFETYNFTVDENSSVDVDISIDPEMLGRIFENLLARIDPITGENIRSMTGSYYTPREIVDRMVDSSLMSHINQKLGIKVEKLNALFSNDLQDDLKNPLLPEEVDKILGLLGDIKVLDPACGSGAFPIGAMQRIVFVLGRLDPDAHKWLDQQIAKLPPELQRSIKIQYAAQNLDYVRKLTVIRSSIYGIDIQPVAIEIAKLRCFLTLIVNQDVSARKGNRGIQPLPNLDFKFVCADSLIPLVESVNIFGGDLEIVEQVQAIRTRYFATDSLKEKEKLKQDYVDLLMQQSNDFEDASRIGQMKTFNPFDAESVASFFDSEFFFGFQKFNIILGNPPYIDLKLMTRVMPETRKKLTSIYESAIGSWDLFIIFIEMSLKVLDRDGVVSMIVKNQLLESGYAKVIRRIMGEFRIDSIIDYSAVQVFKSASVYPIVFQLTKTKTKLPVLVEISSSSAEKYEIAYVHQDKFYREANWGVFFASKENREFVDSFQNFKRLRDYTEVAEICPASMPHEAYDLLPLVKDLSHLNKSTKKYRKLINTGTIDPFEILWGKRHTRYLKSKFEKPIILDKDLEALSERRLAQSKMLKIIISGMAQRIEAVLDVKGEYLAGIATVIIVASDFENEDWFKYVTGILNSALISRWFTSNFNVTMAGGFLSIKQDQIKQIPIAEGTSNQRKKMIELVDQLHNLTEDNSEEKVNLLVKLEKLTRDIYGMKLTDKTR